MDAYAPIEIDLAMSAEVTTSTATGAASTVISAVYAPANTFGFFGLGAVSYVYRLQGGDVNFSRSGWAKMEATFKAKPGVN